MGIHNRDYIRDEPPGGHYSGSGYGGGRAGSDAWAIKRIIIACVVVFFLQNLFSGEVRLGPDGVEVSRGLTGWLDLNWDGLTKFQLWRVVTYGFCHDTRGLSHVFFNMFGLWIFGRAIEQIYGAKETLAFFVATVAVSGVVEVVVQHFSGLNPYIIGASGGVMGVLILTTMHFPKTMVQFLFIPFSFELRWLALGYVALDVWRVMAGGTGIAALAHLSGAAFGYAYYQSGLRLTGGPSYGRRSGGIRAWLKSKLASRPKKPARNADQKDVRLYEPPKPDQLEAEVDRILEKINRSGRESLTPEENELLLKASERYKNRV